MRRLITILVLVSNIVYTDAGASTPKVTTSKELPKVVVRVVKKEIKKPLWFVPLHVMKMWSKVNICEMGGTWGLQGPIYSGGLGIRNINWIAYGGLRFAPNAGKATPMQQVYIARRIQGTNYVPDQYGCGSGW